MIDWRQKLRNAATAPKRADCMSIEDANLWITVLLNEIDRLHDTASMGGLLRGSIVQDIRHQNGLKD